MLNETTFLIGIGISQFNTVWGNSGELSNTIYTVSGIAKYEYITAKLKYGKSNDWDCAFNGHSRECSKIDNLIDTSLYYTHSFNNFNINIGYGYVQFDDYGRKPNNRWKESDSDYGLRFGIDYNLNDRFILNVDYSDYYRNNKHKKEIGGTSKKTAISLNLNYIFS